MCPPTPSAIHDCVRYQIVFMGNDTVMYLIKRFKSIGKS